MRLKIFGNIVLKKWWNKKEFDSTTLRIYLLFTGVLIVALIFVGRLYSIQILSRQKYIALADHQYISNNYSLYDRGSIYFTNKDGEKIYAANLKTGFTVAINPSILVDPEDTYTKLSKIIDTPRDSFLAKASKKDDPYEEIAKQVDVDIATKIQNLDIKGLQTFREQWRYYPWENSASQVLGFVGYKGDVLAGRYGLERQYENVLDRENQNTYVNFFAEIFTNIKDKLTQPKDREGDIVTTIEPTVQTYLEKELEATNKKWDSDYTGGIIIDPKTGEIYAMGVYPAFNPNDFSDVPDVSVFRNPNVEDVFEMGSIIKALTMAAGLDSGVITQKTTYNDTGCIKVDGSRICNYDFVARGVIPMQQILDQSLNVGASWIATQMGDDLFSKYMYDYGLGEKTGIDLPNEALDIVTNLESPRQLEHDTASFGQGIALTPVATARALSTLANGGYLITPHIVKEIDYTDGGKIIISPKKGKQVLKTDTSNQITSMLIKVMDDALAGGKESLPHYSIGIKTGTAQVADPSGGYYSDFYFHSFFGYFPAHNPRFLILLYTMRPHGTLYASHTLTEPFMDTTKFLINYYDLPPDR